MSLFVVGLLVSLTFGFQYEYLSTIPVYYGVFGIAWVLACENWGLPQLPAILEDLRICFKDEDSFVAITNSALKRLGSLRGALWTSAGVFVVGLIGLVEGFAIGQTAILPAVWYQTTGFGRFVILGLFDAGCSLPMGTGLWLLYGNARLLWALRHLDVIPLPGVVIARFRRLSSFYLYVALTWFLGVGLFGLLFFRNLSLLAGIILTITSAFGLVTSLGPQLLFHHFIAKAASDMAADLARVFKTEFVEGLMRSNISQVIDMLKATEPGQLWVIRGKDLLVLAGGQLLPMALVAVKGKLGLV